MKFIFRWFITSLALLAGIASALAQPVEYVVDNGYGEITGKMAILYRSNGYEALGSIPLSLTLHEAEAEMKLGPTELKIKHKGPWYHTQVGHTEQRTGVTSSGERATVSLTLLATGLGNTRTYRETVYLRGVPFRTTDLLVEANNQILWSMAYDAQGSPAVRFRKLTPP